MNYHSLAFDLDEEFPLPEVDIDSSDEEIERYIELSRGEYRSAWAAYIEDFN